MGRKMEEQLARLEAPPTLQRLLILSARHLAPSVFSGMEGGCVVLKGGGALLVKTPECDPPEGTPPCMAASMRHAALRRCSHILFEEGGPVAVGLGLPG